MSKKKYKIPNNYYVNNKEFYDELCVWLKKRKKDKNEPLTESIGNKIYNIVYRYSFKPNFINYSYKSKFIGDAIYTCVRYADRFDPNKSQNPFAYFTRIAWSSFVKVILEERKISKLKKKLYDIERDNLQTGKLINEKDIIIEPREEWHPLTITKKDEKRTFDTEESYKKYINKKKIKNELV